jgi:hypothetical protein
MNAPLFLVSVGMLIGASIIFAISMLKVFVEQLLENIQSKREIQLLNKKKASFVMDYLQFKKEMNCWEETKKEYRF